MQAYGTEGKRRLICSAGCCDIAPPTKHSGAPHGGYTSTNKRARRRVYKRLARLAAKREIAASQED